MNIYIGDPLDAIRRYSEMSEYRSIATMTDKECGTILGLSLDDGEWKGDAINHMSVLSRYGNFVEGNLSFGRGETYYFSIRYDGTVEVHLMEFSEEKTEFVHTGKRLQTYRTTDVAVYMMRCGFDIIDHLK